MVDFNTLWETLKLGIMISRDEAEFCYRYLQKFEPRSVLEIGTGCGASSLMWASLGAKVTTIDNRPNEVPFWKSDLVKKRFGDVNIFFIDGDSQDSKIVDRVKGLYDFVVIDADHSLMGGFRDLANYASMGEVVFIHDIVGYEEGKEGDDWFPRVFWKGVVDEGVERFKNHDEFINCPSGGWGVLW